MGETRSQALGLRAWPELYGLEEAYRNLLRPPLPRPGKGRYLTDAHRAALDASLGAEPFRGLVCVCPVTPNARKAPDAVLALDRYADWIETVLLPEVARRAPLAGPVGLDGVSLGGYVALEVLTRKPDLFRTLGGVQTAIGPERAVEYAERLAKALRGRGAFPLHLETSTDDPFRGANELLSRELGRRGISCDLEVLPGPHDQAWLREAGTLAMLRWQERKLRG
jgi:enterochelin esterase-like enzyme